MSWAVRTVHGCRIGDGFKVSKPRCALVRCAPAGAIKGRCPICWQAACHLDDELGVLLAFQLRIMCPCEPL